MRRLRHGRALAISAILLGLVLLLAPGSRARASGAASRSLHDRPAETLSPGNGPIPFILDLSKHKRHAAVAPAKRPHPKSHPRGQV